MDGLGDITFRMFRFSGGNADNFSSHKRIACNKKNTEAGINSSGKQPLSCRQILKTDRFVADKPCNKTYSGNKKHDNGNNLDAGKPEFRLPVQFCR